MNRVGLEDKSGDGRLRAQQGAVCWFYSNELKARFHRFAASLIFAFSVEGGSELDALQ